GSVVRFNSLFWSHLEDVGVGERMGESYRWRQAVIGRYGSEGLSRGLVPGIWSFQQVIHNGGNL
ncbi:MAG: hypothetical protein P8Z79_24090, partial [Sedimentisphaerales bacterium]